MPPTEDFQAAARRAEEQLAEAQAHWPVGSLITHPYTLSTGTIVGHRRYAGHVPVALVNFGAGRAHWMAVDRLLFAAGRTRRDVLLSAAGLIARNGWIPDDYVDYTVYPNAPAQLCRVCTLGAIAVCAGLKPHIWASLDELDRAQVPRMLLAVSAARVLARRLGIIEQQDADPTDAELVDLISENWNDRPGQTQGEIISALLEAGRIA